MAQIPDADKLRRIRLAIEALDTGEFDLTLCVANIRWALDQEDVSDADMELAISEAKRLRNSDIQ